MQKEVDIELYGINLRVYGDYSYSEAETNSPSEFDINDIEHNGENIYDIIDPYDIEKINELAIKKIED